MTGLGKPSTAVAASEVVGYFVYVGDQKGVLFENANSHCWSANLVVVRRRVGQNKISGRRNSISSYTLLEMLLDQIQLVHANGRLLNPVSHIHWSWRTKVG